MKNSHFYLVPCVAVGFLVVGSASACTTNPSGLVARTRFQANSANFLGLAFQAAFTGSEQGAQTGSADE